jgi:hypothetical protein
MENDFLDFMTDTVEITPFLHADAHGRKVYDETKVRTFRARIVGKELSLRRSRGEEDTSIMDIYISGVPIGGHEYVAVSQNDRLVLPDVPETDDRTPEIYAVGRYPDDQGFHHYKIQCGFMYHRQGAS